MMARKTRTDSAEGKKAALRDQNVVVEIPEGVKFDYDEEFTIWRQFSAARSPDAWREFDLLILAKMVRLEYQIRLLFDTYIIEGAIKINARGTGVENPILRSLDTFQRMQLSMIRSLSLGVQSDGARELNKGGKKASDKKDLDDIKKGKLLSLIDG